MKTKNSKQETIKSRVEKMVLRATAVVASLVLISLTVTAQDFWKQLINESSSGKMALLMIEQPNDNYIADAVIEAIQTELEAKSNTSAKTFVVETDADQILDVEPWMTSTEYFNSAEALTSKDEALEIENWMTSNQYFNKENERQDEPLKLEAWMTDNQVWGF